MQSQSGLVRPEIVRCETHLRLRLILKGSNIASADLVCPDIMLSRDVGERSLTIYACEPRLRLIAQRVAGTMRW